MKVAFKLASFTTMRIMARMSFNCPNCGVAVDERASACPECGSDERTGWSENTLYDGLDLPTEAFEEDHAHSSPKPFRKDALLMAAGLLLLLIFVFRFVFGY